MSLFQRLKNHDWFYGYSDDHRVWRRGRQRQKELARDLEGMNCPYNLAEIRMTVQDMILEDFAEEGDSGYWYRQPRKHKNVAGVLKTSLIERARANEITRWFKEIDNESNVQGS